MKNTKLNPATRPASFVAENPIKSTSLIKSTTAAGWRMRWLLLWLWIPAVAATAQTTVTTTNGVAATSGTNSSAPPTVSGALTELYEAIESSGLTTATNYALEPYLTYAQNAPSGNKAGGGMLAVYNVSHLLGAGLGFDYLGQFSLVSANLTLKAPLHPFSFTATSWGTNLVVAPFVLAGVGTPFSGTGSGAIAVTDAGAYIQYGHLWGGQFNTGIAYGRWDNAGAYSGPRMHLFLGWSKGF